MLVLSRNYGQKILIEVQPSSEPQIIEVVQLRTRVHKGRLGIKADASVKIRRGELGAETQEKVVGGPLSAVMKGKA
jgi:sRNA-binding carbon storage regulator CsrA